MKKRHIRLRTIAIAVAASMLVPTAAWASTVLPYNYTVDYISGGDGGVSSTVFRTANTNFCVTYYFKVKALNTNGTTPNLNYTIRLYKNQFLGGQLVRTLNAVASPSLTLYAGGKTCWTGLQNNVDYYMNWQKNTFEIGGLLNGYGTISTS